MADFSKHLRDERRKRGWDQAQLARVLGVTQQTVSRWERGVSKPRTPDLARIAGILELQLSNLPPVSIATTSDESIPLPVRPLTTVLPVADLAPDRFEELVADLVRLLLPETSVSRVGGQGHKQFGFDVMAVCGDRVVAAYQCKRVKEFGPAEVRSAVAGVTLDSEAAYLVLTRPAASPRARLEMGKHPGWVLWDAEDLSREIRMLPLDDAVRLVDTYFPGWREQFLGIASPGPWLRADDYFGKRTFGAFYTHQWQLVGRTEELAGILEYLEGSSPVGCLLGRGGIGKTRLLREVAHQASASGLAVRVLPGSADLTAADVELLPATGRLLLIVDDAHQRSDIAELALAVLRRNTESRILLALRPFWFNLLANDLRQLGLRATDLPRWQLDDLSMDDAEKLAREALDHSTSEAVVRRLGALSADCPLITVVAGVLIAQGRLDPTCLDHEEGVRTEVLRTFRDVLVADPVSGDPSRRRSVLDALALLQPFRSDDPTFQSAMSLLVGVPYDRAFVDVKGLEDAGVVMRRGPSLRVVPDLLGDVVLADACFDERGGTSTGYIERAASITDPGPMLNMFVNACRLDWQVRHDHQHAPSLTDALWDYVDDRFGAEGITGRKALLERLRKVAYFAPERTLALARWAMDNPTESIKADSELESAFYSLHPVGYDSVLKEIPPLLKQLAYNFPFLPRALELLWALAQGDTRPTNQFPDHPLRALQDLAALQPGKPLSYNEVVVDAVEDWLAGEVGLSGTPSPFDVLRPMLATEGMGDEIKGFSVVFRPYLLTAAAVAPLRQRIIDIALRELRSPDVGRAVRGADLLDEALRYPHGYFGNEVDETHRESWTPEFVTTIRRMTEEVRAGGLDAVVVIALERATSWHANHSSSATRTAALELRTAAPATSDHELALLLFDGWGRLTGRSLDYEVARAQREAREIALATDLVSTRTDAEVVELIGYRLQMQEIAFGATQANPGPFVWSLVAARPSVGLRMLQQTSTDGSSPFEPVLPIVVAAVTQSDPEQAIPAIATLWRTGALDVRQRVAQGLGWNRGNRALFDGEGELLLEMANDPDRFVRSCAVRAADLLGDEEPALASRVLGAVPFADSSDLADDVFQVLASKDGAKWRTLPGSVIHHLLAELEACGSIDGYWVQSFLSEYSRYEPDRLVNFLERRVARWEMSDTIEYRALPYDWDVPLRVRDTRRYVMCLRQILEWMAAGSESWQRTEGGGELFAAVTVEFDAPALDVVLHAANSGEAARVAAVAAVLQKVPNEFVFDNVEFVSAVLEASAKAGSDLARRVAGALSGATSSGVRSGTPGEPFEEDLIQRDRSRATLELLPRSSLASELYQSLQESAEQSIRWNAQHDEQLADRRDW